MIAYDKIEVQDEVHWNGSEGEEVIYTVLEKYADAGADTILLIGDGYSEYEVYLWELN